jgi:ketosteroid isomerase-like protein
MQGTGETMSVVRAYHNGWTSGDFDRAIGLLAPDLDVEVPINDYPTAGSFAEALVGFGGLVRRVDLLSELADGNEAMLLYDMDVDGLGSMRIAEHFTVAKGQISRIRQIHDTAALRVAGFVRDP